MKAYGFLSLITILLLAINDARALVRSKHDKVVVCYVAAWATYRLKDGKFDVENLRPELCTHLIYAFAGLNSTTWNIRSLDPYHDIEKDKIGNYRKMTQLRKKYPHLRVSLAIGGWNEGSKNYSELASSPERRSRFVSSVVDFLGKYGFNGFDVDWEFPGDRGGSPMTDKQNFVSLVKELKEAFKGSDYQLTAAIGASQRNIDLGYDIPEISKYLDHIHVMAYDYHGTWDSKVLPNSPMRSQDGLSVTDTISYLLKKGAPPEKLVLGLPMYGRTFILANKLNSSQESPINQRCLLEGFSGPYTNQKGFMGYNEICEKILVDMEKWSTGWDISSSTPYAINDDHVIVYDNPISIKAKIEYAMKMNLSGVMIWSIDTDDFHGKCADLGSSLDPKEKTFPLMRSIHMVLANSSNNWTNNTESSNPNNHASSHERYFYGFALMLSVFLARYV